MKLTDFEPRWFTAPHLATGVIVYTGFTFKCPCWKTRISVPFANVIVVEMPAIEGFSWPVNHNGWRRTGDTFETITVDPSIGADPHWHGNIVQGMLQTVIPCRKK